MRDLDRIIEAGLDADQRELLRRIGDEPGFFDMALGLFGGRLGWVNGVMMAAQALLFFAGVYAAWMFFVAEAVSEQLRWGLPAAVLLILATMIKMAMWPGIHAERLMRELRRIELQLARRPGSEG